MRILTLAFLSLAAFALGCAPAAPREATPALWRITDADSEIWLFGTVHLLSPDLRWRTPAIDAAFNAADEFVTETDTGPAAQAALPQLAQRYGALAAGETLSALLGEDAPKLAQAARRLNLDPAALERMRPWFAALNLSYAYVVQQGQTAEAGVETVLSAEARAQGKREGFLETPEQQVRFLADLPREDELRFLRITLDQVQGDSDEGFRALDAAWAMGDVRLLGALLDAQWRNAGPAVHEALILNRNRLWADEIAQRLDGSGRTFIAVGAAHLAGEGNVVALLRERGVRVEGP
ncbi:MAG: TraB/GumN family protein [Hyphomonadaceae bacterium]|nr:TraB/GumN family protein [Hyphomonadaceae bacterium]MBX3509667.1 TraB/GumN family protein [Hyphomonadaceae bacterium]